MDATCFRIFFFTGAAAVALLATPAARAQEASGDRHHLSGTVKDAGGIPIPDALVTLGPVPSLFEREANTFTTTGAAGTFQLPVNYPGNATISIWHPDFIAVTEPVSTGSEAAIVLRPGEKLEIAIDLPDALRAGVTASVYFPKSGYQEYARAGRDGGPVFSNLPAGNCELEVRARNSTGATEFTALADVTVMPGKSNTATVALPDARGRLAGVVRDEFGPSATAQLSIFIEFEAGRYRTTAHCDSVGRYSFDALPAGEGHAVVFSGARAGQLIPISIGTGAAELEPVVLGAGLPLRCSFLNAPAGTRALQLYVLFGKHERPSGPLGDARALFDAPAAWSGTLRDKSARVEHLAPGRYTLLAYPLPSASTDYGVFETAEILRYAPVYMDSFTVNEGSAGAVVAAAFPDSGSGARAAGHQPVHPIIGQWSYRYKGSIWTRTFTADGRCILTEGPVTAWVNRYIILGERRVGVLIDGKQRIHEIQSNGTLDVEGQFIATRR